MLWCMAPCGTDHDHSLAADLTVALILHGIWLVSQATPDHFVLVGETRPEYKRAGQVAPGDVMWVVASQDNTTMTPTVVFSTKTVRMAGLYAPLTLSGSIIVNDIAASVHR